MDIQRLCAHWNGKPQSLLPRIRALLSPSTIIPDAYLKYIAHISQIMSVDEALDQLRQAAHSRHHFCPKGSRQITLSDLMQVWQTNKWENSAAEFDIVGICADREYEYPNGQKEDQYRVQWEGFEERQWLPAVHLQDKLPDEVKRHHISQNGHRAGEDAAIFGASYCRARLPPPLPAARAYKRIREEDDDCVDSYKRRRISGNILLLL